MFSTIAVEVFALMVFCKECRRKVEDCPHFVYPITAHRVSVFDPKIETLAYDEEQRTLEIAFKGGQVWQLLGVPRTIYQELRDSTISSFLKFIAQRYKAVPVKTGVRAIKVPETEICSKCNSAMTLKQRVDSHSFVRIFWHCVKCNLDARKEYGEIETNREPKMRWH
jgi:RNase P subunit RPR2